MACASFAAEKWLILIVFSTVYGFIIAYEQTAKVRKTAV
jgi:hypothetical protein